MHHGGTRERVLDQQAERDDQRVVRKPHRVVPEQLAGAWMRDTVRIAARCDGEEHVAIGQDQRVLALGRIEPVVVVIIIIRTVVVIVRIWRVLVIACIDVRVDPVLGVGEPGREHEQLPDRERLGITHDAERTFALDVERVLLNAHRADLTHPDRQRTRRPPRRHETRPFVDGLPGLVGDTLTSNREMHTNAHIPTIAQMNDPVIRQSAFEQSCTQIAWSPFMLRCSPTVAPDEVRPFIRQREPPFDCTSS
jgi:hypothetical protein